MYGVVHRSCLASSFHLACNLVNDLHKSFAVQPIIVNCFPSLMSVTIGTTSVKKQVRANYETKQELRMGHAKKGLNYAS